ncbi:hypothetical protein BWI97_14430 [Siphonobacter sp. BAB-5405]|uniref:hypothetical protein n=1 Tax=Siphonobacter sp. BAB-5405 TaxID=1864825 RepID=UPI000C7FE290|nr:hypothetical protein [Siphonobacter sp. BAB-5405]PMD95549.1 hypothetical protein BWI97_14430 [Siphonobacter sp. BAB-5405]
MLKIDLHSEPLDFDKDIRTRGLEFLKTTPNPNQNQWKSHAYWTSSLETMSNLYNGVCNYCAVKLGRHATKGSIDHFIPKSQNPNLAYEWNNFRFCSTRFNTKKGVGKILDPSTINNDWFCIDFSNLFVCVNPTILDPILFKKIDDTITKLALNDDDLVDERFEYYIEYKNSERTLDNLKKWAPFLASEMIKQNKI